MRKVFIFFVLVTFGLRALAEAQVVLKIVQPFENDSLPPLKSSFVFGSVSPASAAVTINGTTVTLYTNGGFLTMIPFQKGKFKIEAFSTDGLSTATVTRTVMVAEGLETYPEDYRLIEPMSPRGRVVLRPDDMVTVTCHAAPNGKALFRVGGGEFYPMLEQPGDVKGIYKGIYKIQSSDSFEEDDIAFLFRRKDGKKLTERAGASITVQRRRVPRFVELREDSILLTGPATDFGYSLILLKGMRFEVTGEWGDFVRVQLSEVSEGWIKAASAMELPRGTAEAKSVAGGIRVDATDVSSVLELQLQYRHPFRVDQLADPHRLFLTLYGVVADTDRIHYISTGTVVRELTWRQMEPQAYTLDIRTSQKEPWGYDVRYEGTKLIVEIRHRPRAAATRGSLKGLKVAVDAGHSRQSYGTIGPLGNTEFSVNMMVAKEVKNELERRGAQVVMIQDGTKEISLQDRVSLAGQEKAHFYISLHSDACSEGQNPRDVDGYSVHYYHPQSHRLAELIHRIYGGKTKIRDQGVWRSNLAVCRATQMPSILFEQGFLILPEYEEMFLQPQHQAMVAQTIASAIYEFMSETKP
ncbi:MAG: N-acetylmuramoyl-L-alanine amidase [Elusimicrobia bacterium]|nr:N-acetylmuramoyl-L-alanine amidase [Candidatus Obscuribacterium magneticum]MCB4755490.1 N-acetylmuramoyl-L-alanine amidase [Candidatus Obscuribacterium magneticum]